MSSMLRTSRVIAVGLLGLGACANGVVDDLPYEGDPNAQAGTSSSGSGGEFGGGGTTGLGGSLGNGGTTGLGGSAGTSSPFGGSAGVMSGGSGGVAGSVGSGGSAAGSGGSSGAFGKGGSSGAFGTGGSAGKGGSGSGSCAGLPTYPATASTVNFQVGDEIQHKGIRYRVVTAITWANSECAPDIAANWCDTNPDSGQWWEVVGPC
jgi:hypothetical protein